MPEGQRRNNSGGDRQGTQHSSSTGQFNQLRRMPESLAAEAAVLGSMILDPVCIGDVVEKLTADSFYRVEHQYIYAALVDLYQNHRSEVIDGFIHLIQHPKASLETIMKHVPGPDFPTGG